MQKCAGQFDCVMRFVRARPSLSLLIVLVAIFLFCIARGLPLVTYPDSASYLELIDAPVLGQQMQTAFRTPGYPLFLRMARFLGAGSLSWIPHLQLGIAFASALGVAYGLRQWGAGPVLSTIMGGALAFELARWPAYQWLMTDSLGLSLAILSMAGLMIQAGGQPRFWLWPVLALTVFAAYMVRPVYLFLVPLVPALAFALRLISPAKIVSALRFATLLAMVTLGPFLAYSTFRWVKVNHFGVVAFGGANIIGISAQFLTPELIPDLPTKHQPLAQRMLQELNASSMADRGGGEKKPWKSPLGNNPSTWTPVDVHLLTSQYNHAIWQVATPAVMAVTGSDALAANRTMGDLSIAIIRARPVWYLRYVANQAITAARDSYRSAYQSPVFHGLVVYLILRQMVQSFLLRNPGHTAETSVPGAGIHKLSSCVFLITFGFFFANMLLVILVEPPIWRYLQPGIVFWPLVAVAVLSPCLAVPCAEEKAVAAAGPRSAASLE